MQRYQHVRVTIDEMDEIDVPDTARGVTIRPDPSGHGRVLVEYLVESGRRTDTVEKVDLRETVDEIRESVDSDDRDEAFVVGVEEALSTIGREHNL